MIMCHHKPTPPPNTTIAHALVQADVIRLQKIQNSCIRFAYGIRKYHHVTKSYHDAGWLQLDKITK
nr:unnamed protein product [Callosobruchus chinensis]